MTPSPPSFANTWNASQISPKSTMRPLRGGGGVGQHAMGMHVRVDAAWHDDMPCCVDQMLGGVCRQRFGSGARGDRLAGDRDVTADDALGRHHIAAANNEIKHPASRNGLSTPGHSGLSPVNFTTLPHFSVSSAMS